MKKTQTTGSDKNFAGPGKFSPELMQKKTIIKRAILAVIAVVVLLAAVIYLTLGWYTKMTGVAVVEFNTARWDFTANYQIDSFEVNVYEYSHVDGHNIAAPGTAGTIDLRLGADDSDTDVHYLVQIDKSTMNPEFQKRIYFYYYPDGGSEKTEFIYGSSSITGTIPAHGSTTVTLYWEWIYNYDEYIEKRDEDPFLESASEIASAYADDYDKLGFDYDLIYDLVQVIEDIPEGTLNLLKSLYSKYNTSYTGAESIILNAIADARYNDSTTEYWETIAGGDANILYLLKTITDGEVTSLPEGKYRDAAELTTGYGGAEQAFDKFITSNALNINSSALNELADYLFGQRAKTPGMVFLDDASGTPKVQSLLDRAYEIVGDTKLPGYSHGNVYLQHALFKLLSVNDTALVNSLFNNYNSYKVRAENFHAKYYTAVSSGIASEVFSSAMAKVANAAADVKYMGDYGQFILKLDNVNPQTPYDYIKLYSEFYSYSSLSDMMYEMLHEEEAFDEFDTLVASYPAYYKQLMTAKVYVIGEQVKPEVITK